MALPGTKLIKVSGILMIILGAVGTFSGVNALSSGETSGLDVFELLIAVLMLASGIGGLFYCKKPDKATLIMGAGIAICAMKLVDLVVGLTLISGVSADNLNDYAYLAGFKFGLIFGTFIGMIPSILYIVGGYKLKNS